MLTPEYRPSILYLILAHHPPSQLRRTVNIGVGGLYHPVCARCLGKFIALVLFTPILTITNFELPIYYWFILVALSPLPAAIDWTTQTIRGRESTNVRRILTGFLWGISVSLGLVALIRIELLKFGILFAIYLIYIAIISISAKRADKIESVLRPFEEFVAQRNFNSKR